MVSTTVAGLQTRQSWRTPSGDWVTQRLTWLHRLVRGNQRLVFKVFSPGVSNATREQSEVSPSGDGTPSCLDDDGRFGTSSSIASPATNRKIPFSFTLRCRSFHFSCVLDVRLSTHNTNAKYCNDELEVSSSQVFLIASLLHLPTDHVTTRDEA